MAATEPRVLTEDLRRARSQFQAWRQQRLPGSRIPSALWRRAVRLVRTHGLSRTATALGLDYYRLKKQVELAAGPPPSSNPAFVELLAPSFPAGKQARVELDNGAGASLRMHLLGYDAADLEALTRRFWNAE